MTSFVPLNQPSFATMPQISHRQAPPLADISPASIGSFPAFPFPNLTSKVTKDKLVVVMGATGTGKSRLAIDLAACFGAEVVNSDKMQVYDGLSVVTNKVTPEEKAGIPHHLLGGVPQDAEFTARDFCRQASRAVDSILGRRRLPIIAGGSNSYIEELMEEECKVRYDCCFLWVDVELPVLYSFVSDRVDRMMERGLVEEVRELFDGGMGAEGYSRGVRRAIGVPELDRYLRAEAAGAGREELERELAAAVEEIKENTCKLACRQRQKIRRLRGRWEGVHRLDATSVFRRRGREADEAWEEAVARPSVEIVRRFLRGGGGDDSVVRRAVAALGKRASAVTAAGGGDGRSVLPGVGAVGATW